MRPVRIGKRTRSDRPLAFLSLGIVLPGVPIQKSNLLHESNESLTLTAGVARPQHTLPQALTNVMTVTPRSAINHGLFYSASPH